MAIASVVRVIECLFPCPQYEEWNDHARKLLGYIQTRNKPPIFYLPAQHNSDSEEQARKSRAKIEGDVATGRVCVCVCVCVCVTATYFSLQRLLMLDRRRLSSCYHKTLHPSVV